LNCSAIELMGVGPQWVVNVDRLTSMTVFAKVAATRSFSGAARELGISQATASKHVQTLEDWMGARLLHRTTRRVALTDAGESFFIQCSRILEDMESARNAMKPEAPVRGSMRITAPVVFGSKRLGPLVVDFLHQHPELSLSVELSDRSVDLIEEGYDLAIRTGPTEGAGLIAWRLMPLDYVLCAAPSYLRRHGVPATPVELSKHHCITSTDFPGVSWRFNGPDGEASVQICGRLHVNNAMLRCDAARAGAGVLLCAGYLVEEDIAGGGLVRLLPEFSPASAALHAVSPTYRAGSPKVRSLVSHLTEQLSDAE
jgi:DNA-binding transcriptional LysR family regulator